MYVGLLQRHSLKTRVTLFTIAVFIVSLWGLSFMTSRMLHADMQRGLGQQQTSALNLLSQFVSQGLEDRLTALDRVAQKITLTEMNQTADLQRKLDQGLILHSLFNGGAFVVNQKGQALADTQFSAGLQASNFADKDLISQTLSQNKATIGHPTLNRVLNVPVFGIAAPIHDLNGEVIGAVVGITDLSQPNFLGFISEGHYGETGGYVLMDPPHRRVITASDRQRIFEQLPPIGEVPAIDRFLAGFEGTQVFKNPLGIEVLATDKRLQPSGWILSVMLPTDEAFAPIHEMEQRMLTATALLTLFAAALTWWLLSTLLNPALSTIRALTERTQSGDALIPLEPIGQDEIGALVEGFNGLLGRVAEQQSTLQRQHAMLARTETVAHLGSWQWELATDRVTWSEELFEIFQLEVSDQAPSFAEQEKLYLSPDLLRWRDAVADAIAHHRPYEIEMTIIRPDGSQRFCVVRGEVEVDEFGTVVRLYGSLQDVTEAKLAQLRVRLAANVFDYAHEGITITSAEGKILEVNEAFCRITGYSRDEVIGQTPNILKSGRQDAAFYQEMWHTLQTVGVWSGEIWNRRKTGEIHPEILNISAVRDPQGVTQQYVALFSDITRRKEMEERIHQLAFFDALTNLPNRRLLNDRLSQALLAIRRSGRFGALMFLDLDNFKPLNDTHGHAMGDLLLVEVANRLRASVREMDTVARIGGDEFVVMLSELDADTELSEVQARAVAEKIRSRLAEPYVLTKPEPQTGSTELTHLCTASVGGVLVEPSTTDMEAKMVQADTAMYQAKARGRNQVLFVSRADPSLS
jgi:diguanylate cyclase (GGDEF)-like protein/PAS domain S-box-containing protein